MKAKKHIVDTTLRDGEQSPDIFFSRSQKLAIAEILAQSGIEQIEVGAPSTGAYEQETVRQIIARRQNARIAVWSRLNLDDVRCCISCGPDIVHISVPVSPLHIFAKLHKDKKWVVSQLCACVRCLKASAATASIGFEDAFRADRAFLLSLSRILRNLGVSRIRLADTVGAASPTMCAEMASALKQSLGEHAQIGFHAHNDFGMALANTVAALKNGCDYADTTMLGIGERAGNCDFAALVRATESLFDWGATMPSAIKAQEAFLAVARQKGGMR
jgi:homocitrate synthase NifV